MRRSTVPSGLVMTRSVTVCRFPLMMRVVVDTDSRCPPPEKFEDEKEEDEYDDENPPLLNP